ncbi:MAG: L,D-transpeptidase family protein [Chlorobiaceae bacterium]|nr:L,D-transpeptidase family protein [Chlorobiaceae bacterium]
MSPIFLLWFALLPAMQPSSSLADADNGRRVEERAGSGTQVSGVLRQYLARLERLSIGTTGPDRASIIRHTKRFYEALGYRPAWTNRQAVARLIEVLEDSANDGLLPSDYHLDEIRSFYQNPSESPELRARADLLMTDAVLTLMSHMRSGKVYARSIESDWNIEPPEPGADYDRTIMSAVMGSRFPEIIQKLRPSSPEYSALRRGLVRMKAIAASGGWESVPSGRPIDKVGAVDARIPDIRRRLAASGDYVMPPAAPAKKEQNARADSSDAGDSKALADSLPEPAADYGQIYDQELFDAVKAFQKRHGLETDGVVGNETVRAMNVSVGQRIDQIRINLERYRWYLNSRGPNYIMVNIPSFSVDLVQNNIRRWNSRVIVGKPDTQTPVFRAEMQYIILNPHWVIPNGIIVKDKIISTILKDESYLDRKNLAVVDNEGHTVSPSSVDWARYVNGGFPYRLVQASGDEGSLGRIKFMLPNRFTVYLHDTPTKELFEKSRRTFSHGCVRVDKPVDLAEIVLQDKARWSKGRIQEAIDTDKTRTINLPKSIPVYLLYQTAFADGAQVEFRTDVYDRDARLLKVLQSPASSRFVDELAR